MSVYSTPKEYNFDEGCSPSSIDSLYYTPRVAFSCTPQHNSRRHITKCERKELKFKICNEELSQSDDVKGDVLAICKSCLSLKEHTDREYNCFSPIKETVASFNQKNSELKFSSAPSLFRTERSYTSSPLKDISNSFFSKNNELILESKVFPSTKHFNYGITTIENEVELKNQQADSTISNYSKAPGEENEEKQKSRKCIGLFRGIGRKLKRKKKSKIMVMDGIDILKDQFNQPSDSGINPNNIPQTADRNHKILFDSLQVTSHSTDSETPLLQKSTITKSSKWNFSKIPNIRITPIKRLVTCSTKYVISWKQTLFKKLLINPVRKLFHRKNNELKENKTDDFNYVQTHNHICTTCLTNMTNKDEMISQALSSLFTKLSTMEEELKEMKLMMKNGALNNVNIGKTIFLPPPPPPPPPPPNFFNPSGTLKRKADLTTPENNEHPVKRPAIKNEIKSFAITVEDIKSVKLRKTPATLLKKESKDLKEDSFRSLKLKKSRKNGVNGQKRSLLLAEMNNRESISLKRNPIADFKSPEKTRSPPNYQETPLTSKGGFSGGRSYKRKELLIESPIRKRFNDGNNSSIHCDESD